MTQKEHELVNKFHKEIAKQPIQIVPHCTKHNFTGPNCPSCSKETVDYVHMFAIRFKKWCDLNFVTLSMERKKQVTTEEMLQEFIKQKGA